MRHPVILIPSGVTHLTLAVDAGLVIGQQQERIIDAPEAGNLAAQGWG